MILDSFFKAAIGISVALILFNLGIIFIGSLVTSGGLPIFPFQPIPVQNATGTTAEGVVEDFTGMTLIAISGIFIGLGGFVSFIYKSFTPVGISIFGTVFWGSYAVSHGVFENNFGIPGNFMLLFTVAMVFLFISAIIGMAVGGD